MLWIIIRSVKSCLGSFFCIRFGLNFRESDQKPFENMPVFKGPGSEPWREAAHTAYRDRTQNLCYDTYCFAVIYQA